MQNICELPIHDCSRERAPIALPVLAALLLAAISSPSQTSSVVKDANVYNRAVLLVGNDKLEVAIVKQGGSMLRIRIQGDPQGISPFGNPELVPGVPDNRKLNGPMVGHFVCVDGFGSPSKEEAAAGLAMHGEAYLQPWELVSAPVRDQHGYTVNLTRREKQAGVATVKFTVDLTPGTAGSTSTGTPGISSSGARKANTASPKTATIPRPSRRMARRDCIRDSTRSCKPAVFCRNAGMRSIDFE